MKKLCLTILALCLFTLPTFSASWEVQDARKYYTNGQYSQALKSITSAIEGSNSNDPVAYELRAKVYLKMNSPISALKDLTKEIEILNTKNYQGYQSEVVYHIFDVANIKGNIFFQMKEYDKALEEYTYVINNYNKYNVKLNEGRTNIFISNLKKFINNKTIPDFPKIKSIYLLVSLYEVNNLYRELLAADMKLIQIVANADENCEFFNKTSKKEMMSEYKKIMSDYKKIMSDYKMLSEASEVHPPDFMQGLYEYAIGNKVTGMKIIQGVLNEAKAREGTDAYTEMKASVDYIINVLDNGI